MIIADMTAAPAPTAAQPSPDLALSGATPLADWGLIRARGADTVTFLQGQLTNELASAGATQARLAGYCSPKGRLLASFVAWQVTGAEDWLLACSADVLPPTLKRLSMFVMRAQCKLSQADDVALWGLVGPAAQQWLGTDLPAQAWGVSRVKEAQVVRLPDVDGTVRCLWAGPADQAPAQLPALSPQAWQVLEVRSGVARIVAATSEAFVPQMVNFELVGGVNFKKGCYPGQEVVARSQYRGTLKRRGALLATQAPMQAGQEIFLAGEPEQPAGQIALAASADGQGWEAFAEVKRAALAGELHLGSAQGPALQVRPLPYAVPQDEA